MNAAEHIVVFSHGFGVKKDDRGLFTDIAQSLKGVTPVLFDYNLLDEVSNTMTVRPFSQQARLLEDIIRKQREEHPDAIIDLVCHSQGSRVAAIAQLEGVRKTILIAPPTDGGIERMLNRYRGMPGAEINLDGMTKLPRSDGSVTLVPAEYFAERMNGENPIDSYNALARRTELTIIAANQDQVLGEVSWESLDSDTQIIRLDGNHDFAGEARVLLLETIQRLLL